MENQFVTYIQFHTPEGTNKMWPTRPGATLVENFNEELDSFNCYLDLVDIDEFDSEGIERGDFVTVYYTNQIGGEPIKLRRFVLSSLRKRNLRAMNVANKEAQGNKRYYRIEIELVSETVMLENIMLPNLTHRIVLGASTQTSLYEMITRYLGIYGETQRTTQTHDPLQENVYSKPLYGWSYLYTLATTKTGYIQDIYGNDVDFTMNCPEMQFNQPNLREVLNDLFYVADCLPVVREGKVYAMPLKHRGNEVSLDTINYFQSEQKLDDYATELKVEAENVMGGQDEVGGSLTKIVEYTSPRLASGGSTYQINNENMVFKTSMPIMDIISVELIVAYSPAVSAGHYGAYYSGLASLDITKLVVEQNVLATKDVFYAWNYTPGTLDLDTMSNYQNFCLTYTRGSNNITGFNKTVSNIFNATFNMQNNITNGLKKSAVDEQLKFVIHECGFSPFVDEGGEIKWSNQLSNYPWSIRVTYRTSGKFMGKAGRYLQYRRPKTSMDNQTNSYVDIVRFGDYEYSNVDRYGNEATRSQGLYEVYQDIPNLADTIDNGVIYKRTIAFNRSVLVCDMESLPYFILRSFFFGANARIRSWQIASGSEATTRTDITKLYAEFSFSPKEELYMPLCGYDSNNYATSWGSIFTNIALGQLIYRNYPYRFERAFLTSNQGTFSFNTRVVSFGNSIVIASSADDNYQAISYVAPPYTKTYEGVYNQMPVDIPLSYTNDYGQVEVWHWQFTPKIYHKFDIGGYYTKDLEGGLGAQDYQIRDISEYALIAGDENSYTGAKLNPSGLYLNFLGGRNKDSMETLAYSTQFEYCSDTPNIAITKDFVNDNILISNKGVYGTYNWSYYDQPISSFKGTSNITQYATLYSDEVVWSGDSTRMAELLQEMPNWDRIIVADLTCNYPQGVYIYAASNGQFVTRIPVADSQQVIFRVRGDTTHYGILLRQNIQLNGTFISSGGKVSYFKRPYTLATTEVITDPQSLLVDEHVGEFYVAEGGVLSLIVRIQMEEGGTMQNVITSIPCPIEGYEQLIFRLGTNNNDLYQMRNNKLVSLANEKARFAILCYNEPDLFKHGTLNTLPATYDNFIEIGLHGLVQTTNEDNGNSCYIDLGFLEAEPYSNARSFCLVKIVNDTSIPYLFFSPPTDWQKRIYVNYLNWRHDYVYNYVDGVVSEQPLGTIKK